MNRGISQQYSHECSHCDIRSQSVFCSIQKSDIDIFSELKSFLTYSSGQLIFKEGGYPNGFFVVYSGKIKISKEGIGGREMILRFAKEGDIIGYRSLLGDGKYACSATAIVESCLCFVPKDALFNLIKRNPEIAFNLMKLLADDLKKAETSSTYIAQKQVRARIAEALIMLKDTYGLESDGITLHVSLSREELAGMAGTVRETATKLLSEFNQEHIIELEGKKIKLLNQQKLIRIAQDDF